MPHTTSAYVSIRQHTSAYADALVNYVSIRQHTSAYASIRPVNERADALVNYVSIRQHTSAHASIRPVNERADALVNLQPSTSCAASAGIRNATTPNATLALHAARRNGDSDEVCLRLERQQDSRRAVASIKRRPYTSACVSIRPHTSAYVRIVGARLPRLNAGPIRQHASAYVRIRQHT